ncbi:major facilitator superfamily domain-containing protein [Exophiala viscosa]|uniref:major facilitator superfamily domain-containing protein n=1 Tax=Exophiala viscosa TaxID=2486360 RepID=UPI0021A02CD4|nr:major facilitator superfamily domain-containing protein [Exophiala viscosa]
MSFISWALEAARFGRRPSEQEPLLQHASVPDALEQAQEPPLGKAGATKDGEGFALKLPAVMYSWFAVGINTASIGALLPLIEAHYNIRDATAALIFVIAVSGYLFATTLVHVVHVHLGRRGASTFTFIAHLIAAVLLSMSPSYAITLMAYFLAGMGAGFCDSSFCTWAANVTNPDKISGLIHGSYSMGCVVGPMIVAALASAGFLWQTFYLVMIIAFGIEAITLLAAFRHDDGLAYRSHTDQKDPGEVGLAGNGKAIMLCSLYCFLYVGVETSMGGWLATYCARDLHATPSVAALATSLFWTGMVLGRFMLGPLARLVGLRGLVLIFGCISIGLQLLLRSQESLPPTLCLATAIGFVLGPHFPSGMLMLTRRLPKSIHVPAVAITCSVGQIGGAGAPFIIGLVAQTSGIQRMFDVVLGLSFAYLLVWLWFSSPQDTSKEASEAH